MLYKIEKKKRNLCVLSICFYLERNYQQQEGAIAFGAVWKEVRQSRYEGMALGSGPNGCSRRRDSNSGGSFTRRGGVWQDTPAGSSESSVSLGLETSAKAGLFRVIDRSLWFSDWIRFPCGISVGTFYSFKMSDNTGGWSHWSAKNQNWISAWRATLQGPLFLTALPCKPNPKDIPKMQRRPLWDGQCEAECLIEES